MGLKVVLARSEDGYLAKGPVDDMRWTGPTDKAVFKLLTLVGGTVAVGRCTASCMPSRLPGRELLTVTRTPDGPGEVTLEQLASKKPGAWLAGGLTVVLAALELDLVDELFLVTVKGVNLGGGIPCHPQLGRRLSSAGLDGVRACVKLDNVHVSIWRKP